MTNTDPIRLLHGDCLAWLPQMPDEYVDAIVTDPPYGLGFMGKHWDDLPPGLPWARECLRVLKPGGHLLAFGGTRTSHRLAVAVEDAGFEIRDSIAWLYGSGFPKSLDVSKAIDKLDATDERRSRALEFTAWMRSTGISSSEINAATGSFMGGHYLTDAEQPAVAVTELFDVLRPLLPEVPARIEALVEQRTVESRVFASRDLLAVETRYNEPSGIVGIGVGQGERTLIDRKITAPATDDARAWAGWGTALKPAFEPIIVGRKPLVGTVAANVLAHGTGALHVDACRVAHDEPTTTTTRTAARLKGTYEGGKMHRSTVASAAPAGRWPTNVLLDEGQAAVLDAQTGTLTSGTRKAGTYAGLGYQGSDSAAFPAVQGNEGGASRFFPTFRYQAKAPGRERPKIDGIAHPTVKPLDLMRWLVRLVCPPGAVLLDPFAGSGTTLQAAVLESVRCIGIEREESYLPLILDRLGVDVPVWQR